MYTPTEKELAQMGFEKEDTSGIIYYKKRILFSQPKLMLHDFFKDIFYSFKYEKWDLGPVTIFPKSKEDIVTLINLFTK